MTRTERVAALFEEAEAHHEAYVAALEEAHRAGGHRVQPSIRRSNEHRSRWLRRAVRWARGRVRTPCVGAEWIGAALAMFRGESVEDAPCGTCSGSGLFAGGIYCPSCDGKGSVVRAA